MADNLVIVDTNILLYLCNDNQEVKKAALYKVKSLRDGGFALVISDQVIREFLVAQTNIQKIFHKVDNVKLKDDIQFIFHNFSIIWPDIKSVLYLEELISKYNMQGKIIHDANIVSVAKQNNIYKIFTNNASDFLFALKEGFEIITL